jgi:hypothetical protein
MKLSLGRQAEIVANPSEWQFDAPISKLVQVVECLVDIRTPVIPGSGFLVFDIEQPGGGNEQSRPVCWTLPQL